MSEVKTDSVVNVSGDNDSGIDLSTNDVVAIKTADSERVRVASDGKVGIGTTSPDQTLHVHKGSAGSVSSSANSVLTLEDDGDVILQMLCPSGNSQQIRFGDAADNGIGLIQYDHSDNSMRFNTNGPEKMRLSTNGYLQVGQNTSNNPGQGNDVYGLSLRGDGRVFASANGTYSLGLNRSDSGELTNFSRSGDFKGSISISTSAVAYNTTSDHRLKENVSDMTGAITRLKTLQPKRFNFIADPDDTVVDGFLAHEVSTAVPEAIQGTHNATDDDGNPIYQQIDQAKLVPLLVGALQEAIAKIETLETKVTALEDA